MDTNFFPGNSDEALAFLYVTRNCPDAATPEDLQAMYDDAYARIRERRRENRQTKGKNFF